MGEVGRRFVYYFEWYKVGGMVFVLSGRFSVFGKIFIIWVLWLKLIIRCLFGMKVEEVFNFRVKVIWFIVDSFFREVWRLFDFLAVGVSIVVRFFEKLVILIYVSRGLVCRIREERGFVLF